jgi:hypothetical protein
MQHLTSEDGGSEQAGLEGFRFFVGSEGQVAVPDAGYFRALAQRKGRPEEVEFFDLLQRTRPDGVWPVFVQQKTDSAGCTRLSDPRLVELYRGWARLRKEHPTVFAVDARKQLAALEYALTEETCVCDDASSAAQGLASFLEAFPHGLIASKVRERLEQIRTKKDHFLFHCSTVAG